MLCDRARLMPKFVMATFPGRVCIAEGRTVGLV